MPGSDPRHGRFGRCGAWLSETVDKLFRSRHIWGQTPDVAGQDTAARVRARGRPRASASRSPLAVSSPPAVTSATTSPQRVVNPPISVHGVSGTEVDQARKAIR